MSFEKLEFQRTWKSQTDFPTLEENEDKVRADLQYHPDVIREYVNGLVDELLDSGVTEITRTDGTTMKYIRRGELGGVETSLDGEEWLAMPNYGHVIYDAAGEALPQREKIMFQSGEVKDVDGFTVVRAPVGGDMLASMYDPQRRCTDIFAEMARTAKGENILDNWYFPDPVDQRGGHIVAPNTPYYSDTDLSVQAGVTDTYMVASYTGGAYGTVDLAGGSYYVGYGRHYIPKNTPFYATSELGTALGISQKPYVVQEVTESYGSLVGDNGVTIYYVSPADTRLGVIRGYVASASEYTIDRWRAMGAGVVAEIGNVLRVASVAEGTPYLMQPIKNAEALLGNEVTMSVLFGDGTVRYATGVFPDTMPTDWYLVAEILDVARLAFFSGHWWVCLQNGDFLAAKLELGGTQTLAHPHPDKIGTWVLNDPPPTKGLELMKCCMSTADSEDSYANGLLTANSIGAPRFASGNYVGTGTAGRKNPCTLTVGFKPRALLIRRRSFRNTDYMSDSLVDEYPRMFTSDATEWGAEGTVNLKFTWGELGVSWYAEPEDGPASYPDIYAPEQHNAARSTYYYTILG